MPLIPELNCWKCESTYALIANSVVMQICCDCGHMGIKPKAEKLQITNFENRCTFTEKIEALD